MKRVLLIGYAKNKGRYLMSHIIESCYFALPRTFSV